MGISQGAEEVVALAYRSFAPRRFCTSRTLEPLSNSALYLHDFLTMDHQQLRNVALGMIIALLILSLVFELGFLVVLAILMVLGLILELKVVYTIARSWHFIFSKVITYISNALLALIYIIVLVPYSYLYRLMNRKNVVAFLSGPHANSSYYKIGKNFEARDFENPW